MLGTWTKEIEKALSEAPGNAVAGEDPIVWSSTVSRLGVADAAEARNTKFHYERAENHDELPARPWFVLESSNCSIIELGPQTHVAAGAIDVYYCEAHKRTADEPVPHKTHYLDLADWIGALFCWLGNNAASYQVPVYDIQMITEPTRVGRLMREVDNPDSDFWWTHWRVMIGYGPQRLKGMVG